jgi:hypothetical protein
MLSSPAKDSNGKTIDMGICCDQVVRYVIGSTVLYG